MIIIAGRPSMGKTAFGMDIIMHAAKSMPCGIFSLEMRVKREIAQRA